MLYKLLTCMDSLSAHNTHGGAPVAVIGATNRPNDLDPALRFHRKYTGHDICIISLSISFLPDRRFVRRAGRFDREICLGVPDQESRAHILSVMCSRMRLSGDFDFSIIAKRTPGMFSYPCTMPATETAAAVSRIIALFVVYNWGGD